MATAAQLQQQISTAQQNLSANQATLASLQSQYDAKVIAANSPGNSSMRANLLQDAEDLQVEIANSSDIVRRQGLAIADLNTQLQEAPVVTSDTAANKTASEPLVIAPTASIAITPAEQAKLSKAKLTVLAPTESIIAPTATASEVTHTEAKSTAIPADTPKPPLVNPLHDYPSYTYGLSLALLTVKEYNALVDNTDSYVPNRVIIASAGRYNGTGGTPGTPGNFKRAEYFAKDFYFENLNMTTIIGLNDHSRASNAINFTFSIIEPYGITLMNRIIELSASDEVRSFNYIAQPYLLQIDFFGMNDAGEIVGIIPNQTKRMPIRILKMDIKATAKGAEYMMTASPYNHSAFDLGTVSTPANFEITAGTVASFFKSNEIETAFAVAKSEREALVGTNARFQQAANGTLTLRGGTGEVASLAFVGAGSAIDTNVISKDALYKVKSYGGAINAWYADLAATGKDTVADKYFFNFHDDIKDSTFEINAETLSSAQTAMASEENGMTIRGGADVTLDYKVRVFSINAGTSIDQVITFAMRHSSYLQGQVKLKSDFPADGVEYKKYMDSQSTLPLKWYKIIPSIKLLEYDVSRETWAREITYNIIPYTIYNTKIPDAPQAVIEQPCKVHNYWYTGKNNDVLDFNMEFNALYYTAVTAYREHIAILYNIPEDATKDPALGKPVVPDANSIMPMAQRAIVLNAQQRATGGDVTTIASALADVEASLYTGAGGDMLQARLKIIGDPQYIKQDDIFYSPVLTKESIQVDSTGIDSRLIANGSLHMDNGEVYVQVSVRSPVDVDETTGLMKFDKKYETSLFSGMYRVLKVESTFAGGKFEQILDIVRLPRQTALDYTGKTKEAPAARDAVAVIPLITNADTTNIGPNFNTKTTGDIKAPGSAPVIDSAPPIKTAEEKALANVDKTAPESPIDKPTEPVVVAPPPPPPAPVPSGAVDITIPPPTAPQGATDAQLAASYDYKAQWFAAKAAQATAAGNPVLAAGYAEQVPVYQEYAANHRAP